jgi:hypothetical protein
MKFSEVVFTLIVIVVDLDLYSTVFSLDFDVMNDDHYDLYRHLFDHF